MKMRLPLASVAFTFLGTIAHAGPWEQVIGAWVTSGAECTKIFQKVGDRIEFKERSLALENGIIILNDNEIRGPMGGCTISKTAEENDQFSAMLHCSDAVVSRDFSMSFRIIDETHFERIVPEFGVITVYTRCSL